MSVGSSCNACEEAEEVRAAVLEMDPDGKNQKFFAKVCAMRLGCAGSERACCNQHGMDHLAIITADTMYLIRDGGNYGWPYCYQSGAGRFPDVKFNAGSKKLNCRTVPPAFAAFDAHSSPLGFEYFDGLDMGPVSKSGYGGPLRDYFLVALHGSTKTNLKRGYRVVRVRGNSEPTKQDPTPLPPGRKTSSTGFYRVEKFSGGRRHHELWRRRIFAD